MQKIKISCIAIGVWALLISLAESWKAFNQWTWWLSILGRESISEIAAQSKSISALSFHGLPAAFACPLFLAIGLLAFYVSSIVSRFQNYQRRKRGDLTPDEIAQAVQARIRQAENKGIAKKVEDIIQAYGSMCTYRDDALELSKLDKSLTVRIRSGEAWSQVFEAQYFPDLFDKVERKFLRPDHESGRLEIETDIDHTHYPAHYQIRSYIPGEWEQAIESLYLSARHNLTATKEKKELDISVAKKTPLEEERKRFGI